MSLLPLSRTPLLAAALLACATALSAQTPPAEIVPPKAAPPAVGKPTELSTPTGPLSPGSKAPAEAAAGSVKSPVDALSDADLDEILTILKQRYVSPAALAESQLKRSTVQGLLERLRGGATLETATNAAPAAESPFRSELLPGKIGYLRLGSIDAGNLTALDQALAGFAEKAVVAEVLDLRATPPGVDFELAAEVCRRWAPKGKVLFTVQRHEAPREQVFTGKGEASGKGMLVVLIGSETAGSAEIVAGTLRILARAIVIGQKTKGAAAEMAEATLASGARLRFAVAEAKLADGSSLIPAGVTPDLPVAVTPAATAEVLKEEEDKGVPALLAEIERPRLNEAALVAGKNPEVDALEAAQRLHSATKPHLHDVVLQRAIDLVASVAVFEHQPRK